MTDPDDEMSLEEARRLLLGHQSPYSGEELTDAELDEASDALGVGDDPPEDFSLSEAHRLATGKEGETDL